MASKDPDRYALLGHPVSHSWSPFIHGLFARQFGHDIQYRLVDVAPEKFRRTVVDFFVEGGKGLNVTVPHKRAAAEVVNELTPRAERARAVNTILSRDGTTLVGDNTDGAGLITDLTLNLKVPLADRRILLLGAGGATRGVIAPLLEQGPRSLLVANRTAERAVQLAKEFADLGPIAGCGYEAVDGPPWHVIINATSAGLSGDVPPVPDAAIEPATLCYDMSYGRGETPFQRWANSRGIVRAHKGWGMLVEQAAEAYFLWRGARPETGPVLAALENL